MKKLITLLSIFMLFISCSQIDEPDNRKVELRLKGQLQGVNLKGSHFYLRNSQYFDFSYTTSDAYFFIKKDGSNLIVSKNIKGLDGGYVPLIVDTAEIQSYLIYGVTLSVTAENSKGTQITLLELR